jgi:ABC-type xylose transport system permease subunit
MDTKIKLSLGSILGVLGALGMILAPTLGATALPSPWSFVAGFLVGVAGGLGAALAAAGLLEHRRQR